MASPMSVRAVPATMRIVIGSERKIDENMIVITGTRYMYVLVAIAPSLDTA